MRVPKERPEKRSARSATLTRAQERELRAWVWNGTRPDRPMTIRKLQLVGLVDAKERLTSRALVAVEEMEARS